jgi:hypothetical protein
LKFEHDINPQRICQGLFAAIMITNCHFCKWGVDLIVKGAASHTVWINIDVFKGDKVYAASCIKELKDLLPSHYKVKKINDRILLIVFDEQLTGLNEQYG